MEVCLCSNRKASPAICLQRFCRAAQNCQCQQKIWRTCAHCNIRIPRQTLCPCFSFPCPACNRGLDGASTRAMCSGSMECYPHPTPPRQNVRQDSSGRSSACHRHRPQSNSMSQTQSAYPVVPVARSASLSADTHAATPPAPRHRRGRLLDGVSTHVMLCGPGKLR